MRAPHESDWPVASPFQRRSWNPGEPMFWAVYKELYCELLESKCEADSDHPDIVRKTLDRFTRYRGLSDRQLSEVTAIDLQQYVAARRRDVYRDKPLTKRTVNNEIEILNAAFGKAGPSERRGPARGNLNLLSTPPYCEKLVEDRHYPRVVAPSQFQAFLRAAETATTPSPAVCEPRLFWTCALLLDLVTRLRRKALLRVPRPDDAMLIDRMELLLPANLNKSLREDQVIALGGKDQGRRVVDLLVQLPTQPGEPFLPWRKPNGTMMTLGHFSNTLTALQRKAGVSESQRFRLKDVRSTAGTLLADVFTEAVAKKALGHSPNTNTLHTNYRNPAPRDVDREASDFMSGLALPFVEDGPQDDGPPVIRFPGSASA